MSVEVHAALPFTEQAKEWLKENGVDPVDLCTDSAYEGARKCGVSRLLGALENAEWKNLDYTPPEALFGYFYARMVASAIKDKWLINRLALSEAVYTRGWLLENRDGILPASYALGIPMISVSGHNEYDYSMHFTSYVTIATAINDEYWKLATQHVYKGHVFMSLKRVTRVIQEAYRQRILSELPRDVAGFEKLLAPSVEAVTARLKEVRPEEGPAVATINDTFPPCVNKILDDLHNGVNVPHTGRFLLAAFLNGAGTASEEIQACFVNAPDYDAEITRAQIESIKSKGEKGYTPPTCATLRSQSLCFADDFCRSQKPDGTPRVTNPMHYYRAKTWRGNK